MRERDPELDINWYRLFMDAHTESFDGEGHFLGTYKASRGQIQRADITGVRGEYLQKKLDHKALRLAELLTMRYPDIVEKLLIIMDHGES